MIDREHALQAAWKLFIASHSPTDVKNVDAKLIDDGWSIAFYWHEHPSCVESPGFCLVTVLRTGEAEWFDVL